jgi:glycosyltransferase involved in cell wall biosynthesis
MLIGFDASRLGVGQRTGTEAYTWELLQAFGALDRRNHYHLYANGLPPALPPLPPNYQLRSLRWPRLWTHVRLSAEMALRPPDLLFVPAHVLPLWSPRRSVVTIHDLGYLHYPEAHPLSRRLYLRLSTRWNAWRATHLIADSQATRQDIVQHCHVSPGKVSVIYLGVGPQFRPLEDTAPLQAAARRCAIPGPYALYVGTIQPRKNLVRLIEAWAIYLGRSRRNITLVIAGKRGWLSAAIERRAHELGIAAHVHFAGYVHADDLPALLSGAQAFLYPSLYEGFGLPVLEAQACGTPVLTSTTSSLPEVAGDAAVLVDPLDPGAIADGIARVLEDQTLRERLRRAGLARVADWSWRRTARQTLALLETVGGASQGPTLPSTG